MKPGFEMVDLHSHLLPGLDDGPGSLGEALRMCRLYAAQGFRTVVATPHMANQRYRVSPDDVRSAAGRLDRACLERGIDLRIVPGADVRLAPELLHLLDAGRVLTLADAGRHLLLELPHQCAPPISALISELALRGVTPVLSHPERNMEILRRPERVGEFVQDGCLIQITAGALPGAFGRPPQRTAEWLLEQGLVHVVATDAHAAEGPRRPDVAGAFARLLELVGRQEARRLLCDNPRAIACPTESEAVGREPVPAPTCAPDAQN